MSNTSDRAGILKSSLGVAAATLLSRILGLGRVMLETRVLGGGGFASAWYLAFSIPNLFRRLLGEGALGTALIPLISQQEQDHGPEQVRRDLSVIFTMLSLLLAIIVIAIAGGALALRSFAQTEFASIHFPLLATERLQLTLGILPILMPYALFICLTGVIGAVLNTRKVFFLPALGALLLNLFLISSLALAYFRGFPRAELESLLRILALLVVASGLTQLALMFLLLYFYGRFPRLHWSVFKDCSIIRSLWKLALPGMLGGAALQVSFLVDELLAISLGPQAVPAISNVNRIIDLPIGIFALSLGSVLMANLSRAAAKNDLTLLEENLLFGLRHVYFISIPMGISVVLFHEPMLKLMFLGGNYTLDDLAATRLVAIFYGAGIPAFCSLKVVLPAFYSRKIMDKPLYSSLTAIVCNIVLNLILMQFLAQGGIALATVIAAMLNNSILLGLLRKEGFHLHVRQMAWTVGRNLSLSLLIGAALLWAHGRMLDFTPFYYQQALLLLGILGMFGGIYLFVSKLLKAPESTELVEVFFRRKTKKI